MARATVPLSHIIQSQCNQRVGVSIINGERVDGLITLTSDDFIQISTDDGSIIIPMTSITGIHCGQKDKPKQNAVSQTSKTTKGRSVGKKSNPEI